MRRFLLDLDPLRKHRDFRLLFIGQWVSAFGSSMTHVALPVQMYQLTKSSTAVRLHALPEPPQHAAKRRGQRVKPAQPLRADAGRRKP